MAGEGLGRHSETEKILKQKRSGPEVVSVGDFILDRTVPLTEVPERELESWEDQSWYPEPGESQVADVPEEVEQYVSDEFPGGKAANQALSASVAGAETELLARTAGEAEDLAYMNERGVGIDSVEYLDGEENHAYVFIGEDGENRIAADIQQSTGPEYLEENLEKVLGADYVLSSNGMPTETLEKLATILEEESADMILDPSPVNGIEKVLGGNGVEYVTPNSHEYDLLSDSFSDYYSVLKTSAEGVQIDGERYIPAPEVSNVVDTTAAGDTFNGYLAAGLSSELNLDEAVENACEAASISVQYRGAQPSIPEI